MPLLLKQKNLLDFEEVSFIYLFPMIKIARHAYMFFQGSGQWDLFFQTWSAGAVEETCFCLGLDM